MNSCGRRVVAGAVVALNVLLAVACGGPPAGPSPDATDAGVFASAHFVFRFPAADAATIAQTAGTLESHYGRLLEELGSDALPPVTITLYTDHAALVAGAGPSVGVVPPWAGGLASAQDQIHMMSPNQPGWGPYDRGVTNLVHELAHCVSMHINRSIPNAPRWFWEAVAIYGARQFVHPRTLSYMTSQQPPPFDRLNSFDNTLIYDVGYLIGEFIVDRWGRERLHDLIVANADTATVLGISRAEFEQQWFTFVRKNYGI